MCSWPSWQSRWRVLPQETLLPSLVELGRDMLILPGVLTVSQPNDSRLCNKVVTISFHYVNTCLPLRLLCQCLAPSAQMQKGNFYTGRTMK